MTSSREVGPSQFGEDFGSQFVPSGTRLGVIVTHDAPPSTTRAVDAAAISAGLVPARRVARLRPRVGEDTIRPPDIADFIRRYGHEFVSVVLPAAVQDVASDRLEIELACRTSACDLWWITDE